MRSKLIALFVVALLLSVPPAMAQEAEEPTAELSWPPPVYVLRGEASLSGTVNIAGMTSYYIEYRALDDDLTAPASRAFLPLSLPSATAVLDGVLGVWDTTTVADGLYELRLTAFNSAGDTFHDVVGPLRVENEAMMADDATVEDVTTVVEEQPQEETTPVPAEAPMVTARVNANVRSGDSTRFRIIGALYNGRSAPVLGISSRGSGWYRITLPDGREGWISPTVVVASGATDNLAQIDPPPLPPPVAPPAAPAAPAAPAGDVDLVAGYIRHGSSGGVIVCGVGFIIEVDVANFGTTRSPGGRVRFVDNALHGNGSRVDALPHEAYAEFPPIEPGQTVGAKTWMTISSYPNWRHSIQAHVNFDNAIPERTMDNNNAVMGAGYKLARGNCE